jgi:hypothetical protein
LGLIGHFSQKEFDWRFHVNLGKRNSYVTEHYPSTFQIHACMHAGMLPRIW